MKPEEVTDAMVEEVSYSHLKQFEAAERSLLEAIKDNPSKQFVINFLPLMHAYEVTVVDEARKLRMTKYVSVDGILVPNHNLLAFEAACMCRRIDAEPKEQAIE